MFRLLHRILLRFGYVLVPREILEHAIKELSREYGQLVHVGRSSGTRRRSRAKRVLRVTVLRLRLLLK